jgi:DNA polymerase-3 subunit epsilon
MPAWHRLGGRSRVDDGRWVVVDVEASGLDARSDRLLAVAAVAVHLDGRHAAIALADSFEAVLRQRAPTHDKANILLHGIGVGSQLVGQEPAQALCAFEAFVGASPLVAFHAAFDRSLLERAFRAMLDRTLGRPWLDLAPLARVLRPHSPARSLDEWLAACGIRCARRHEAAADALATAELLLVLWPSLWRETGGPHGAARRLALQERWLA